VAIVERLLPRYWDGRRLLRFLAGLALLALAFAVRVDAVATPPAPATAVVSTTVDAPPAASVTETDQSPATVDVPLTGPVDTRVAPAAVVLEPVTFAAGVDQPAYGSRGPPRA
jgi:hypothetical protein